MLCEHAFVTASGEGAALDKVQTALTMLGFRQERRGADGTVYARRGRRSRAGVYRASRLPMRVGVRSRRGLVSVGARIEERGKATRMHRLVLRALVRALRGYVREGRELDVVGAEWARVLALADRSERGYRVARGLLVLLLVGGIAAFVGALVYAA